jgi:mannose-6-phosphate isomerase-like protein (cupin superfamily)/CDGSH-type Zn-finger protein
MQPPRIANRKGFYYEVKAGERYFWCSCGRSANQPFCDGSHAGTDFMPVLFKPKADEDTIFCGCKHTKNPPFCDGAHNNLPGGSLEDDPDSPANRAVALVPRGAGARVSLDDDCYVFSVKEAQLTQRGVMGYCPVISPAMGALFQSQFYAVIGEGASPVISSDDRHTVLFVIKGRGEVVISGQRFAFDARTGVYVRPGEAYQVVNPGPEPIELYISNGPGSEDLVWLDAMADNFEAEHPNRLVEIDPSQRHAMAARFFQMLINREHGSTVITQFIGNIPLSKGEPHRHLYEEALIFLNGTGVVWTERTKTEVGPGDILFLPRKQVHSVQCTSESGLDVVGVIYPGDNPAINY